MKIALGSDHAGFLYKEKVKALLISLKHEVLDCGTHSEAPVPYPEFIRPANVSAGLSLAGRATARRSSRTR
jgi:ribose 5-phosphate isomerase B